MKNKIIYALLLAKKTSYERSLFNDDLKIVRFYKKDYLFIKNMQILFCFMSCFAFFLSLHLFYIMYQTNSLLFPNELFRLIKKSSIILIVLLLLLLYASYRYQEGIYLAAQKRHREYENILQQLNELIGRGKNHARNDGDKN